MGGIINISLIFSFFGSSCCAPNACNAWTTQCTMHVNVCTTHLPFKEHNKNWWHMIQVEFIPGFSTVTFFTFIIIESLYSKKLSQTFIKWCSSRCADFQRKKIECVKLEWLVTTTLTHYRLLWKPLCKDKNRIQLHYNYKDDFRIGISLWKHCLWGTPEYQNAEGSTILIPNKALTRTEWVGTLYQSDISTDKCLVLPSQKKQGPRLSKTLRKASNLFVITYKENNTLWC